ncbi:MAG: 1,4-alpha-glucan branching protein domain-containing protein [Anaerolineales bacterium]
MTIQAVGAFSLVLHSHLPYCRKAGMWPHGEEWLHEALAETYIPLLDALYALRAEGVQTRLTVSLTPVLVEQLADPDIGAHFERYLADETDAAAADQERWVAAGQQALADLAAFYVDLYEGVRHSFVESYGRNIVAAFKLLQDEGRIEISTSAATHGYLPLLSRDSSIYAQIRAGKASYERHFGRAPTAIWLPECAYRPAYQGPDGIVRPALEEFLSAQGFKVFFVESTAIDGARSGAVNQSLLPGAYEVARRRYVLTGNTEAELPAGRGTTFKAYYVQGCEPMAVPPVCAIGRNSRTSMQVWSADMGYPGDAAYREFHRKDDVSGLQYWRVTGPHVDLGHKALYDPQAARERVSAHAEHFAELVIQEAQGYHERTGEFGLVSAHYDTELFGHWWFEGIEWITQMLRRLAQDERIELTTATGFVTEHASGEKIVLPEGSWGAGGTHWTWDNPDTHWMWTPIHEAERRMEAIVARYPAPSDAEREVLNQLARELLLLQSSDWPFLVTTGQAKEYAIERFQAHLNRFDELAQALEEGAGAARVARARELWELDKVFSDVDYRWFAARQGRAD